MTMQIQKGIIELWDKTLYKQWINKTSYISAYKCVFTIKIDIQTQKTIKINWYRIKMIIIGTFKVS